MEKHLVVGLISALLLCGAQSYAVPVITDGLVAGYEFNGDANDASGNGNNATVFGATLGTDRFGISNNAYAFDGDDYLVASAGTLPTAERTVALWFRADTITNMPNLVGYGGSYPTPPGTSWLMGISHWGVGAYSVTSHWGTNTLQYYYAQEPVGAWIHYAVTTDVGGTKMYINGVEVASNSNFINNTETAGTDLAIGVAVDTQGNAPYTDVNVGYFVGSMDDVLIYNRALDSSEVEQLAFVPGRWNYDGDGQWGTGSNWSGGVPTGVDATATFGTIITSSRTITVDSPETLGTMNFRSPISYAIVGDSALTLDVSNGVAAINVTAGSHTIAAPVVLNDDLLVTSTASTGVALAGDLTATGKTITKAGVGTAQFQNVRAAGLAINQGAVKISAKATVNDPTGTNVLNSLSISTGASLDLANNSLIVNYDSVGTLVDDTRQMLAAGKLISSSIGGTLGYADNSVLHLTSFAGQTVDDTNLLVKFTYGGDANLDGQVDISDLGSLATAWQTSAPWTGGDFDYSGFVDISDLGILATNWQLGVGSPLGPSFDEALASLGLAGVTVPEPAGLALAATGAILLTRCRRREGR